MLLCVDTDNMSSYSTILACVTWLESPFCTSWWFKFDTCVCIHALYCNIVNTQFCVSLSFLWQNLEHILFIVFTNTRLETSKKWKYICISTHSGKCRSALSISWSELRKLSYMTWKRQYLMLHIYSVCEIIKKFKNILVKHIKICTVVPLRLCLLCQHVHHD
jgi:hypothetical protein